MYLNNLARCIVIPQMLDKMLTKPWPSGSGQVLWVLVLPEAWSIEVWAELSWIGLEQPINKTGDSN